MKHARRWPGLLYLCAMLPCLGAAQPGAARSVAEWEKFDFARQRLQLSEIRALPLGDVKKLRGLVFGRHGRVFDDCDIQKYLESRPWYRRNLQYRPAQLNAVERANVDAIREAESLRHPRVVPGDMKFYRSTVLTKAQLGQPLLAEIRIMRAEIEAIHGRRFADEPWLQNFFEERYWYRPAPHYSPATLSAAERQNLALLTTLEKQLRRVKLAPGDMGRFQNQPVDADMLHGLGLYELRLLRNEIYARRGRRFRTEWIQDYFSGQPWYKPLPDFREPKLSPIEARNRDGIVQDENQIHENLGREAIKPEMLEGLFLEDARKLRNEIYARRGRIFKDPWLHGYFQSFDWYKANPRYRESQLNRIERRNAKLIFDYEKQADSLLHQVEA